MIAQFAVVLELTGTVIDVAVSFIGIAFIDQIADEGDDVRDIFHHARIQRRFFDVQSRGIFIEGRDELFGDFLRGNAQLFGGTDDLVVHVGEVGDEIHVIAAVFQVAADSIESHCAAGIADMDVVVDGRTTDVHAHLILLDRLELFFFARQGIVDF